MEFIEFSKNENNRYSVFQNMFFSLDTLIIWSLHVHIWMYNNCMAPDFSSSKHYKLTWTLPLIYTEDQQTMGKDGERSEI